MILDLTLKDKAYLLKIHRYFFHNKSMPIALFQADNPLMKKYSYLGIFYVDESKFGFDGCFQKIDVDDEYSIYRFDFPETDNHIAIRKLMMTIYLATYYVVETMFNDQEFFSEKIWDDQTLSFVMLNGDNQTDGYSIGGQLYPWFKRKLDSLSDDDLASLNQYVLSELKRVSVYFFERELFYNQISISRYSFFIQVNMGGRWLSWKQSDDMDKLEKFSSHNIDSHSDQELCFTVIVAINTWLREN